MLETSVNVIQVRNSMLVKYIDNTNMLRNTTGTKETLKQNLKTEFLTNVKNLSSIDTFDNVNLHVEKISNQYNKHVQELNVNYWTAYVDFVNGDKPLKPTLIEIKQLGSLSLPQVKKVRKCIDNLTTMTLLNYDKRLSPQNQNYLTFVTLTLPSIQKHSDTIIRKAQTRFIENMQKTYGVTNYVWKAETQKNGNIHFHILMDMWVCHKVVRKVWNYQLNKLGYIKTYSEMKLKKGFVYNPFYYKKGKPFPHPKTKEQQFKLYLIDEKLGFINPNTTDIHSLQGLANTTNYLLKYMTKLEADKRPIIGAVWGASNITKKLEYPSFYDSELAYDGLMDLINRKKLKCVLKDDYFSIHCGKVFDFIGKQYKHVWHSVKHHYKKLKTYTLETYKAFNEDYKKTVNDLKKSKVIQVIAPVIKPIFKPFQFEIFGGLSPLQKFDYSKNNNQKLSSFNSFKPFCVENYLIFKN